MFIGIWEHYEIHQTMPRKLIHYGNYTFENGLKLVSEEKWIRRNDLQGISFRVLSMPLPGFMAMTPILGDDGQFKMTGGMFPDFWHNLQVFVLYTIYGLTICKGLKILAISILCSIFKVCK